MWNDYIGQTQLKEELSRLKDYNISLLLRGNSGCGKTALAELYAESRGNYDYQLAIDLENGFRYNPRSITHIIDEVHELKRPEILYPFIDSGMVFVFCTNETANLKEPLRNRCIERFIRDYTLQEIIAIIRNKHSDFSSGVLFTIANRSRFIPRTALQLAFLCQVNCDTIDIDSVEKYLDSSGVYADGFRELDLKYLDFIKKAKKASLNTLKSNLSLPESQIRDEIEPWLIKKKLITVSSSGRLYIGEV